MTLDEKKAIMRIMSDLIKADNVIAESEIKLLDSLRLKYKINDNIIPEYSKITFAKALNTLNNLDVAEQIDLYNDFHKLALADGNCCTEEAGLMIAAQYKLCLSQEVNNITICESKASIDTIKPQTVVYVESDYNKEVNNAINANYKAIESIFKTIGFDFVYIPSISASYSQMNAKYLKQIIKYIAPALNDFEQDSIYENLCTLNTTTFCRCLLSNKLAIDAVDNTNSALLIKVGTSSVPYSATYRKADCNNSAICESSTALKDFPVYLKFDITPNNVMSHIYTFVDNYKKITNNEYVIIRNNHLKNDFIYSGFYKSFFDLLAFPGKSVESRIVIDTRRHKIMLTDLGEKLQMTATVRSLYAFIIFARVMKMKINSNESKSSERKRLNSIYCKIYEWIGSDRELDEINFYTGLNPNLTKIRNSIRSVTLLKNKNLYEPKSLKDNPFIEVDVDPSKVYVLDRNNEKEVLMNESEEWKDLLKL